MTILPRGQMPSLPGGFGNPNTNPQLLQQILRGFGGRIRPPVPRPGYGVPRGLLPPGLGRIKLPWSGPPGLGRPNLPGYGIPRNPSLPGGFRPLPIGQRPPMLGRSPMVPDGGGIPDYSIPTNPDAPSGLRPMVPDAGGIPNYSIPTNPLAPPGLKPMIPDAGGMPDMNSADLRAAIAKQNMLQMLAKLKKSNTFHSPEGGFNRYPSPRGGYSIY